MTNEEREEIATLAADYGDKRLLFECLSTVNVYGKTAEELAKLNVNYHLADTEMWAAYYRLQSAKAIICGGEPSGALDIPSEITPNQSGS